VCTSALGAAPLICRFALGAKAEIETAVAEGVTPRPSLGANADVTSAAVVGSTVTPAAATVTVGANVESTSAVGAAPLICRFALGAKAESTSAVGAAHATSVPPESDVSQVPVPLSRRAISKAKAFS
jgi:hypothetical protein